MALVTSVVFVSHADSDQLQRSCWADAWAETRFQTCVCDPVWWSHELNDKYQFLKRPTDTKQYWTEALIPDISAESWPKLNAADDLSLENPSFL